MVWRFAQEKQMLLLTANRSMKGENSLEQVMREENIPTSLPVVTIGNADRILSDSEYRGQCVESLIEIVLEIDLYRGARRIFIP
ncbi:MAG TPA: ACP S-malonyltransferase, partial [Oscillatoriales cyanobacterium M59_W2019_021]|nr:ACP S-malonyltransferase [Oscillatoriales cyanobacterium M59_W2019_021]